MVNKLNEIKDIKQIKQKYSKFYWGLYNYIIIPILSILKLILKYFIPKLKIREDNWKRIYDETIIKFKSNYLTTQKVIWFHSASMGEFEQAKPVIELLKSNPKTKDCVIIVTFFSPSGYENQKNYKYADYILYIPFDLIKNVNDFISTFMPNVAIFIRYDIWFNFLTLLNQKQIPTLLISATFSNSFNKKISKLLQSEKKQKSIFDLKLNFYREILSKIDYIFCATDEDFKRFEYLNLRSNILKSGDTRIDRILNVVELNKQKSIINKKIFNNRKVIIVGSSWIEEEKLISEIKVSLINYQLIIVPHEPTIEHIARANELFDKVILFSELELQLSLGNLINLENKVIVVDSIGKLLSLYSIADFAFVGGGFRTGLHSVLEPAGFGLPIICGPKLEKQVDSYKLKELGGLFIINNSEELLELIKKLNNQAIIKQIAKINKEYLSINSGFSQIIYDKITEVVN